MPIIDTHAHLDHIDHLEDALKRAKAAGVDDVVAVSTDVASSRRNLEIAQNYQNNPCMPCIYPAMGIHPSEAGLKELDVCVELIRKHAVELVAVGEIGLDFWYKWVRKDEEKKEEQKKVFGALLQLAAELDLPVVIHSRGAWKHCLQMSREAGIKRAVFHWYSGPLDVLDGILSSGYYISATPSMLYSPPSQEAVVHAPVEQTLIETDSPVYYKLPDVGEDASSASDGFKAEPKDVWRTLKAYCHLKKIDEEEASRKLNHNARQLFGIKD